MRLGSTAFMEHLEQRLCLCGGPGVSVSGDTLTITGDNRSQIVQIVDTLLPNDQGTFVSFDVNGNGSLSDPGDVQTTYVGINHFVVNLRGGDDQFTFGIGSYEGAHKTLAADLGSGDDRFSFVLPEGDSISHSTMCVDLCAGSGNDLVTVGLSNIRNASTLKMDLDLGTGNDALRTSLFGDVASGSLLLIKADLGSGNDTYNGVLDYESFDILDRDSVLDIDVRGGQGNDDLTEFAGNPETGFSTEIQGLMSIDLEGDNGSDAIDVDLPPLKMEGGTIAIKAAGGAGADDISVTLKAHSSSTGGVFSVALLGGAGNDILFADVNDDSGTITYCGNCGKVLLDGGSGHNTCTTQGNAPYKIRNC